MERMVTTIRQFKKVCDLRKKKQMFYMKLILLLNRRSFAKLRDTFMHFCPPKQSISFNVNPPHRKIRASGGVDVPRKATFYSTTDE